MMEIIRLDPRVQLVLSLASDSGQIKPFQGRADMSGASLTFISAHVKSLKPGLGGLA